MNELKAKGIIEQKQEGYFVLRFLSTAGYFSTEEMAHLMYIANTYGDGRIGLTSRLTIELNYIKAADLDTVRAYCTEAGLRIGGGGPSVRAVLTCKGSVCKHGLTDTQKLTLAVEDAYFGQQLPGKFKIAVLGCSNSYGKAQGNDLSILPIKQVKLQLDQCIACKKCMRICPTDVFSLTDTQLHFDETKCIHCGKCIPVCPTDALSSGEIGYLILLGGRLGRKARLATPLPKVFKEEDILPMVGKVLDLYASLASPKERFSEVIERIGLKELEARLLD